MYRYIILGIMMAWSVDSAFTPADITVGSKYDNIPKLHHEVMYSKIDENTGGYVSDLSRFSR